MMVTNTSPLINFGKQGRLDIICSNVILIPEAVYIEILRKESSPEVLIISKAIKDKTIIVEKIRIHSLLMSARIGQGEKEAITLAYKYKCNLIIDDDSARSYAALLKVEARGTLSVLLHAVKKKKITKPEAKKLLEAMISERFYISTELYREYLELLSKI